MTVFIAGFEFEQPYLHSLGPSLSRFFTALRDEQRILARRCTGCGIVAVPPRDHCQSCGAPAGEWIPVGPCGTVIGSANGFGRVKLDGADTALIHRVPFDARGLRVHPRWAPMRTGTINDIECFAINPVERESKAGSIDPLDVLRTHPRIPYELSAGELQSKFMDSIKSRAIHGNRCARCGNVFVPPRAFCSACWIPTQGWIEVSDSGTVQSFVIVNVPFYGQQVEIPYVLASVVLDGSTSSLLHIMHGTRCEIGLRVKAVWRSRKTGFINEDIDRFEPI